MHCNCEWCTRPEKPLQNTHPYSNVSMRWLSDAAAPESRACACSFSLPSFHSQRLTPEEHQECRSCSGPLVPKRPPGHGNRLGRSLDADHTAEGAGQIGFFLRLVVSVWRRYAVSTKGCTSRIRFFIGSSEKQLFRIPIRHIEEAEASERTTASDSADPPRGLTICCKGQTGPRVTTGFHRVGASNGFCDIHWATRSVGSE